MDESKFCEISGTPKRSCSPPSSIMSVHPDHVKNPPLPPEVYYKITDYLNLLTLKSCRLVSHMFRDLATTTLQRRGHSIQILYRESTHQFVASRHDNSSKKNMIEMTLQNLNSLMDTSLKFPVNGFILTRIHSLSNPDLDTFFQRRGHLIRNLKLTFYFGQHSLLMDVPRLLRSTPNLERFELLNVDGHLDADVIEILEPKIDENDEIQILPPPPQLQLPSLKFVSLLRYDDYAEIITKILTAAPNLQTCHQLDHGGLSQNFVDLLIKTGKVHTLHQLRMTSHVNLDTFSRLTSVQPKLTCLTFNLGQRHDSLLWPRLTSIISKLLESSQHTLKSLTLESGVGFLWKIVWPQLVKCKKLFIEFSSFQPPQDNNFPLIFPHDLNWQLVFPFLTQVVLDFWYLDNQNADQKNLPITGTSFSVTHLTVQCRNYHADTPYPVTWFEELPRLFPNLTKLDIEIAPTFLRHIFNIFGSHGGDGDAIRVRLKILRLKMVTNCQQFSLDSALTGLKTDYCRHIFLNYEPSRETYEGSRMTVMELRDLEELEIIFGSDQKWCSRNEKVNHILTKVSASYGFQRMKKMLRVKVVVNLEPLENVEVVERAFKSIAPYVNLCIVPSSID